ncbi:hypothetical protein HanOQP8_Chr13g0471621 [Helianthus annuus]|nr:hypothetical protein HanLR1_Chr13g0472671 [Helianthus annuus]KAJ0670209.1 hypothetical protein HanOQP8_Chr13g0471621 [Helianthus annuus]
MDDSLDMLRNEPQAIKMSLDRSLGLDANLMKNKCAELTRAGELLTRPGEGAVKNIC